MGVTPDDVIMGISEGNVTPSDRTLMEMGAVVMDVFELDITVDFASVVEGIEDVLLVLVGNSTLTEGPGGAGPGGGGPGVDGPGGGGLSSPMSSDSSVASLNK